MPTTHPHGDAGHEGLRHGLLLKIVDAGLLAILAVAPLFMGGRHPLGELVFVSLVALMTSTWLISQCFVSRARYTVSGAEGLLVAGVLLVVFQLVSLPQSILNTLSPGLAQALPLWVSGDRKSVV